MVVIAMSIWFRRNTVIYREFTHPNRLIQEAEAFLNEYIMANAN
jgi:hypothetical protein